MSVFCFSVSCERVATSLPRVLDVFAMQGLTPDQCHAVLERDGLTVDLQMAGLDAGGAGKLAKRLGRVVTVKGVLVAEKCA